MSLLITSSSITLRWLKKIKEDVENSLQSVIKYREHKYWASFHSTRTHRNIAYLQPQKTQIRLILRLVPSYDDCLQEAPCSKAWAETYPSLFVVNSDNMIEKGVELIISSYEYDLFESGLIYGNY